MTHQAPNGPWGWQPPQPRKNRRAAKVILALVGGFVALIVIVGLAAGKTAPQPSSAPMGTASPEATKAAANGTKPKPKKDVVTFVVTGKAPAGVDFMYGNDTDNRQGPKGLPGRRTLALNKKALYYVVTAQLQGSGDITCKVLLNGKVKARGHASGSYNICTAQWNGGLLGF